MSAVTFIALLEKYRLGDGETECLAFALSSTDVICCDDGRARRVMTQEIGTGRVTGSLGLLISIAADGLLAVDAAVDAYQTMIDTGGFLPNHSRDHLKGLIAEVQKSRKPG